MSCWQDDRLRARFEMAIRRVWGKVCRRENHGEAHGIYASRQTLACSAEIKWVKQLKTIWVSAYTSYRS